MLPFSSRFSTASLEAASTFLSGTHARLGRGSLPFNLSQRGSELVRCIAEFVLVERSAVYVGHLDGRLELWELDVEGGGCRRMWGAPMEQPPCPWALVTPPGRVCGLAASEEWLVAVSCAGWLRAFALPSHDEAFSLDLGTPFPATDMVVSAGHCLVASKRAVHIVDLRAGAALKVLPAPWSGAPAVLLDGAALFAKGDEAVRMWPLEGSVSSVAAHTDLRQPHRHLLVSMAVPSAELLVTASPQEVSGWRRADIGEASLPLWTVAMCHYSATVSRLTHVSGDVVVLARRQRHMLALALSGAAERQGAPASKVEPCGDMALHEIEGGHVLGLPTGEECRLWCEAGRVVYAEVDREGSPYRCAACAAPVASPGCGAGRM